MRGDFTGRAQLGSCIDRRDHEGLDVSPHIVEALPVAAYACDASGRILWFNRRAADLWGRVPRVGDDTEVFCGSHKLYFGGRQISRDEAPMAAVMRTGKAIQGAEGIVERPDGSQVWATVHIEPVMDLAGNVVGAINCFHDTTELHQARADATEREAALRQSEVELRRHASDLERVNRAAEEARRRAERLNLQLSGEIAERKRAEQRLELLLNELAHRGKNLLAVIQTIVSRSLSGTRSGEAREALAQRLQALARSQTLLVNGAFEGASLCEIIRLECEAFSGRVNAVGPDVILHSKAAQTFALLVHELATNATKHGALSKPAGRVGVSWSIENAQGEPGFKFRWLERDGPPVRMPTRQGFGLTLIEKAAAQEFGAKPRISFDPEGLSYDVEVPLSTVSGAGAPFAPPPRTNPIACI